MIFLPQSRRSFLQQLTAGALGVGLGGLAGGCGPILQAIQNRPVRRNIAELGPSDLIIEAYKDAVRAMQALPSADGRNWTNQATIHLDHCPHGNWYFLPWHRAYLFYFEQICRELSGYADFALPYWNWTTSPAIPSVFWGDATNPLFDATRVATPTSQASSSYIGASVIEGILALTNFELFASYAATGQRDFAGYGELEGIPHNNIHGFVGGNMGTYMSPLDPVFWTHHNMIDCLWWEWNANRGNPNTNDPNWLNFSFTGNFVDRTGAPVNISVVDTLLMPLLSYRCEDVQLSEAEQASLEGFLRQGAPTRLDYLYRAQGAGDVEVAVGRPATLQVPVQPGRLSTAALRPEQERVVLTFRGVQPPVNEDFFLRVFVGRREISQQVTEDDPHFVGALGFFEDERHRHPQGRTFTLDVTDELSELARARRLGDESTIPVHVVAVPYDNRPVRENRAHVGAVELSVVRAPDPQTRRSRRR